MYVYVDGIEIWRYMRVRIRPVLYHLLLDVIPSFSETLDVCGWYRDMEIYAGPYQACSAPFASPTYSTV
jgi:hypothetical protein